MWFLNCVHNILSWPEHSFSKDKTKKTQSEIDASLKNTVFYYENLRPSWNMVAKAQRNLGPL